ncbi:MAG: DUF2304 domain-containing protein [Lachnospiraceae bacterium]|nr:DUF2304 domain-containing protein [Lachnospiraceae bacterium]
MTLRLQIILAVVLVIVFIMLINRIRKERLDIRFALPWMALLIGLFIIDVFPGITQRLAALMGIELPINMLMLLGLTFSITIIFFLTSMTFNESDKQKQVIQELGLLRKEVEELKKREDIKGEVKDERSVGDE